MTTMTQDAPAAPVIRRPGIGIAIDPARLRWMRERKRALSRDELAARITALNLTDERGRPLRLTRDAIAKIENPHPVRGRSPKPRSIRALCAALECDPEDLMPDGPALGPDPAERRRHAEHLRGMADFARKNKIRYTKPSGGRSYNRPLRDAYAAAVGGAPDSEVAALIAIAREQFPADDGPQAVPPGELIDVLDLPSATHNKLISAGILTTAGLAARSDRELRDLGLSAKAVAVIRGKQAGARGRLAS